MLNLLIIFTFFVAGKNKKYKGVICLEVTIPEVEFKHNPL